MWSNVRFIIQSLYFEDNFLFLFDFALKICITRSHLKLRQSDNSLQFSF